MNIKAEYISSKTDILCCDLYFSYYLIIFPQALRLRER